MQFNINDEVRMRLTDYGRAIHRAEYTRIFADLPQFTYRPPTEDADGWSTWQLWSLMQTFGASIGQAWDLPFETTIELDIDAPQAAAQ